MNHEMKALETVINELEKVLVKYQTKAEKERAKVNDVYVTICGDKCYTEDEINTYIEADYISAAQADKYIEKLEKKQAQAGQEGGKLTKSELVCKILDNTIGNYASEVRELKHREEQEQKRQERWEIAKAQGCTYQEWLNQEEVSRLSEEYEENLKLGMRFKN